MSLDQKNKSELEGIARALLIDMPTDLTKKEMVAVLLENNVTKEDYENLEVPPEADTNAPVVESPTHGILTTETIQSAKVEVPEPTVLPDPSINSTDGKVLLRCDRQNPVFNILQYRFTRDHPFQLVSEEDADYLVRNIPGFRPALASEAQEFYS